MRVEPDESVLASVLEALKAQVELENELDAGKDAELDTEAVHKVLMEQGVENPLELLFGDKGLGCLYDGERDEVNLATEARFWETTIMWQLLLERRLETWKSRLLEAEKNMLGRFMDSPEIEELLEADLEEVCAVGPCSCALGDGARAAHAAGPDIEMTLGTDVTIVCSEWHLSWAIGVRRAAPVLRVWQTCDLLPWGGGFGEWEMVLNEIGTKVLCVSRWSCLPFF